MEPKVSLTKFFVRLPQLNLFRSLFCRGCAILWRCVVLRLCVCVGTVLKWPSVLASCQHPLLFLHFGKCSWFKLKSIVGVLWLGRILWCLVSFNPVTSLRCARRPGLKVAMLSSIKGFHTIVLIISWLISMVLIIHENALSVVFPISHKAFLYQHFPPKLLNSIVKTCGKE